MAGRQPRAANPFRLRPSAISPSSASGNTPGEAQPPPLPATLSESGAVNLAIGPCATMVTGTVALAAPAGTLMVAIAPWPEVISAGTKVAVAPVGSPVAESWSSCAFPCLVVVETAKVTVAPAATLSLLGADTVASSPEMVTPSATCVLCPEAVTASPSWLLDEGVPAAAVTLSETPAPRGPVVGETETPGTPLALTVKSPALIPPCTVRLVFSVEPPAVSESCVGLSDALIDPVADPPPDPPADPPADPPPDPPADPPPDPPADPPPDPPADPPPDPPADPPPDPPADPPPDPPADPPPDPPAAPPPEPPAEPPPDPPAEPPSRTGVSPLGEKDSTVWPWVSPLSAEMPTEKLVGEPLPSETVMVVA